MEVVGVAMFCSTSGLVAAPQNWLENNSDQAKRLASLGNMGARLNSPLKTQYITTLLYGRDMPKDARAIMTRDASLSNSCRVCSLLW